MCKIAILTCHNPDKLKDIIESVWRSMAATEKDGYGAAWVKPDGTLGYCKSSTTTIEEAMPDFCLSFGESTKLESNGGPLLIHGRTATCGVNLENTHPILCGDSAMVHNGIVNSKRFHNVETTCDSELLVHAMRKDGVTALENDIEGYYAFGLLTVSRKGSVLDVVRDATASLHAGRLPGDGWVFATTQYLITVAGGQYASGFKPGCRVRFVNGKLTNTEFFTPKNEASQSLMAKAEAAFKGQVNDLHERGRKAKKEKWRGKRLGVGADEGGTLYDRIDWTQEKEEALRQAEGRL